MNQVANVNKTAVAAPAFMDAEDFNSGFENADASSFAIPFLQILQKMSPMVDEDDPKHIEGAKAGMIYNTVTQKLIDGKTGLQIIPCYFKRSYILWGGREGDGGFKGEITPEEFDKIVASGAVEIVDNRPLVKAEDGTTHPKKSDYYADTRSHYVIVIDPDNGEIGQAILSLASTQIKASKMMMTALNQKKVDAGGGVMRTPPTFGNMVRLTTISQNNDKGSWSGVNFTWEGPVTDPALYALAKQFKKDVEAGAIKVDHSKNAATTGDVSDEAKTADTF
jgi:hypothetical protein